MQQLRCLFWSSEEAPHIEINVCIYGRAAGLPVHKAKVSFRLSAVMKRIDVVQPQCEKGSQQAIQDYLAFHDERFVISLSLYIYIMDKTEAAKGSV